MGLLRRLYRLPLLFVLLVLGLLALVLIQPWLPMGGRRAIVTKMKHTASYIRFLRRFCTRRR